MAGVAIVARNGNAVIVLRQRGDPDTAAAGDGSRSRQQRSLQLAAVQTDERAYRAPERLQVVGAEHSPVLVAKQPAADDHSGALHSIRDAEPAQHAHAIGLYGDAAADRAPLRIALDELGREAALMQCRRGG